MTNKEAITTLKANYPDSCYEQLREAVDAAIKALEALDAAGDTISRAAAINAHCELCGDRGACNCDICPDVEVFRLIPSQPETHEERTETHACDLISRQAAIDAINKIFPADPMRDDYTQGITCGAALANIYVGQLPSAQPEPCEDAVSRQRLLSDLKELVTAWKKYPVMAEEIKGVEAVIGYVELIPSVKPNSKELSETHKALDTISRQAAIDAERRTDGV